jgi:hypothetical protein
MFRGGSSLCNNVEFTATILRILQKFGSEASKPSCVHQTREVHDELGAGIISNAQCEEGISTLRIATRRGHVCVDLVARALLLHDTVHVNKSKTIKGSFIFHVPNQEFHLEVVLVLLQLEKVNVNLKDKEGATTHVSQNDHFEVSQELLQRDDIEVNLQGHGLMSRKRVWRRSPRLAQARQCGCKSPR